MAIHTTPTVLNKTVLLSLLLSVSLFGKDVPIVESLALSVSASDKSVIEFPFKITSMSAEDFVADKSGAQNSYGAPEIKKGDNVLEITGGSAGSVKTIVWGYDHPIFLDIKVEQGGEKYYKFTDPIGKNSDVQNFETNAHEDVVVDLTVAAFNEKIPKGYQSRTKSIKGGSGNVSWAMQMEYVGDRYSVQSWKVTNNGKEEIELYEEMFASEKNKIYGISIEAPKLKPNEATRVFIVKKAV